MEVFSPSQEGRTLKKKLLQRSALAIAVTTAGLSLSVLPASAGNDSPNAPRANPERITFCNNTGWWRVGFRMTGTSNDGRYGTWQITGVVDDPHQTRIDATFTGGGSVSWYCV
jgi:hypothetical protein